MRRKLVIVLALALAVVAGACAKAKKATLQPDVAPETFLFIHPDSTVSATSHAIQLHWWGSDVDGDVVAFDIRFIRGGDMNTPWTRIAVAPGKGYDSLFVLQTADSALVAPEFEVRAVDNAGVVDATPVIQQFFVTNLTPIVTIQTAPASSETTFASATASWTVNDPDAHNAPMYRVWMNSDRTNYDSTFATSFTVPSHQFFKNNAWIAGRCTLNVQAVDDGGRAGPVAQTSWNTRPPAATLTNFKGRMLIIDDVPALGNGNFTIDTLYRNTATRNLPAGSFSFLTLRTNQPFHSARDLAQTFRQFDAVVWYRGFQTDEATLWEQYADSIGAYTMNGGRLFLESLYMLPGLKSPGWLAPTFLPNFLSGIQLAYWVQPNPPDSTVGFGNIQNAKLRSSMFQDSLIMSVVIQTIPGETAGIRAFTVTDTSSVMLWADPNQLVRANPTPLAVAINQRQPGGGRLMLVTFPVRVAAPTSTGPAFRMLRKMWMDPLNGLYAP